MVRVKKNLYSDVYDRESELYGGVSLNIIGRSYIEWKDYQS